MKILFVVPNSLDMPGFGHQLELMQVCLDEGHDVVAAVCNSVLPTCDVNPGHNLAVCSQCIGRRLFGFAQLSRPVRQVPIVGWPIFDSDSGYGLPQAPDPGSASLCPVGADPRRSHRLLISRVQVYRSLIKTLAQEKFDLVYLPRLDGPLSVAMIQACEFEGVICKIYDPQATYRYLNPVDEGNWSYRGIELRETGFFAGSTEALQKRPMLCALLSSLSGTFATVRLGGRPA